MAKRMVDARQRRAEIAIAILFVVTAAASISGGLLYEPALSGPDYLVGVFPNRGPFALGALLVSINNIGLVFIAVFAFPLLWKLDQTLAIGYLAVRIIEGTLMMVGIAATLLFIPLSEGFIEAGTQGSWFAAISDIVKQFKLLTLSNFSLVLLGLGGLIFCWPLFRFQLVPRHIMVVGLIGYALVFLAGIGAWFGVVDMSGGGWETVFAAPVAVFEIVLLPAWLLFRGFNMPGAASGNSMQTGG